MLFDQHDQIFYFIVFFHYSLVPFYLLTPTITILLTMSMSPFSFLLNVFDTESLRRSVFDREYVVRADNHMKQSKSLVAHLHRISY